MVAESTKDTTFEVCNARKDFMGMEPNWRKSLKGLSRDPPLSPAVSTRARTHTHSLTHSNTLTHTHINTRTHTHTHVHTHTQ
jgi:hypothetical protein